MSKHGSICQVVRILSLLSIFVFIGNTGFAACPSYDLNGDCFVGLEDFVLMAKQWLTGNPKGKIKGVRHLFFSFITAPI
jgi:hypothetical protein